MIRFKFLNSDECHQKGVLSRLVLLSEVTHSSVHYFIFL